MGCWRYRIEFSHEFQKLKQGKSFEPIRGQTSHQITAYGQIYCKVVSIIVFINKKICLDSKQVFRQWGGGGRYITLPGNIVSFAETQRPKLTSETFLEYRVPTNVKMTNPLHS